MTIIINKKILIKLFHFLPACHETITQRTENIGMCYLII